MIAIIRFHDRLWNRADLALSDVVLPTAGRFVFAAVLLVYYWNSGLQKLGDGIFGFLSPSAGAYAQIFPKEAEAVLYDVSQFSGLEKAVVLLGTWAEFLLPLMIVLGILTRLASLGMIGFIVVQSVVDVVGHGAGEALGAWFDRVSDAPILDQRAMWVFLLLTLVLKGGGPLSVDRLIGIGRRSPDTVAM